MRTVVAQTFASLSPGLDLVEASGHTVATRFLENLLRAFSDKPATPRFLLLKPMLLGSAGGVVEVSTILCYYIERMRLLIAQAQSAEMIFEQDPRRRCWRRL